MSSPEPSVTSAPDPGSAAAEPDVALLDSGADAPPRGGNGAADRPRAVRVRSTPVVARPAPSAESIDPDRSASTGPEHELDDPLLAELSDPTPIVAIGSVDRDDPYDTVIAEPAPTPDLFDDVDDVDDTGYLPLAAADELDEDDADEFVEVIDKRSAKRGRLKARKVRRVVRYVSPWSVLKVSLLFYACLWVIGTIAAVILWRVAVETGAITNVEKFVARLFGEKSFTIDGREIFRASTVAGVILVFAGTGFTVLMSLLFNVICDITGGIRFTVLELESTKRRVKKRLQKV